jgi:hypothetical protein
MFSQNPHSNWGVLGTWYRVRVVQESLVFFCQPHETLCWNLDLAPVELVVMENRIEWEHLASFLSQLHPCDPDLSSIHAPDSSSECNAYGLMSPGYPDNLLLRVTVDRGTKKVLQFQHPWIRTHWICRSSAENDQVVSFWVGIDLGDDGIMVTVELRIEKLTV